MDSRAWGTLIGRNDRRARPYYLINLDAPLPALLDRMEVRIQVHVDGWYFGMILLLIGKFLWHQIHWIFPHVDNIESVRVLYQKLNDQFGNDSRFEIFFHKISNLSGDKGAQQTELGYAEYWEALAYVTDARSVGDEVNADVTLSDYICYAAHPISLLVRADGRIEKCMMALNDPRNDVGRLPGDGTLDLDQQ